MHDFENGNHLNFKLNENACLAYMNILVISDKLDLNVFLCDVVRRFYGVNILN